MKKHFLNLTLICLACCRIFAGTVTVTTAQTVAVNFFKNNAANITSDTSLTASLVFTKSELSGAVDFYVFNISPVKGFVIVSAEDNAQPILGYSTRDNFYTNFSNIGLSDWMTTTSAKIKNIVQQRLAADARITNLWSAYKTGGFVPSSRSSTVSPLLTTTWDQYPYYNLFCPYNSTDDDNAVTGCVATAMAQIMKFWNFPTQGTGSYSYDDAPPYFSYDYGEQSFNFGATTFQWSKMPNSVTGSSNDTAVAALMYACGVAVAMDYGDIYQGGSGAYVLGAAPSAQAAYSSYFLYNASTIQGVSESSYTSDQWTTLLENELLAGRPIQYEGFDPSAGGHTWVCDGFDASGLFDMNWGWSGYDDGYYNVTSLSVDGYNFSTDEGALIGIEPGTLTSCGTPSGLNSSSINTNSATISWAAVSGAVSYNLEYKTSSTTSWTTVSVTGTSNSLTGLTAGTTYDYQVQTVCSGGSSSFSTTGSFTTLASCGTPAGLSASSITSGGATVSWGAVSGASSYNLEYQTSSSSTWTIVSVTGTSYSLSGLTSSTGYNFQVQCVCSSGSSAYSTESSFTTLATATCGIPAGLTASSVSTSSATVSWGAVSGASSYNLEYKTSSASTWTTVSLTSTSDNLTGLTANTAYDFQVQTICSFGSSAYSTAGSFTTTSSGISYCTSSASSEEFEYIDNVTIGSINNTAAPAGYANYTNLSTNLTIGVPATISLTPGFTSSSYTEYFTVYIDYNHDGSFTDAGELVAEANGSSTTTTSVTVPSTALTGSTRMRIQMQYGAYETNPCATYSFGEVQDYAVNIVSGSVTCGTPSGLSSSSISTTGATVSWGAVSGATSYNLEYKTSSASTWTAVSATSTSSVLNGLTSSTTYDFQVQTICSSGSSPYSTESSFTTLTPCGTPSDLASSSVTTTEATVGWGAVTGANSYNLEYKTSSASTWTSVSTSSTSYGLTSLESGTTYNFQVQTICSSGSSAYSAEGSFTTSTSCGIPSNLESSTITAEGATVSWGAVTGANSYSLQYKTSTATAWNTISVTTTSYALSGLTSGTEYDYQVQTICSSGSSGYSIAETFTTGSSIQNTYCTLTGLSNEFEYINEVAFGSFSNISGNTGGYANFTNLVIPFPSGTTKSFALTPGYYYGNWPEGWAIYIDYKKDGLFTDPGDQVYASLPTIGTDTGSINIPSGLSGTTVMRIAMEYDADASPCGSYAFGAVQDYTVNLSDVTRLLPGEDVTPPPAPIPDVAAPFIYPNPASDQLTVVFAPVQNLQTKIEIVSIMGQVVLTQVPASAERETNINVAELPAGVYLVRMTIGDRVITQKLVKQ